jgi:hypothetical protein
MAGVGRVKLQQFGDSGRARLMDRGTDSHLHGFEIELASSVAVREDPLQLIL